MAVIRTLLLMESTAPGNSDPLPCIAHWKDRDPNINHKLQKTKRFPDFILTGQLNLHKSSENAALLSRYIAKQWIYLRINRDGIISSKQLEINRNPDKYGGLRDGKPLTVAEWNKSQEAKLLAERKSQALLEGQDATGGRADTTSRASSRGQGRGRSRGRSNQRGRSSSSNRGRGRGRGRGR